MSLIYCTSICTVAAGFYITILAIIYFTKDREKNTEKYIYNLLLIDTIVSIALELICDYFIPNFKISEFVVILTEKLYLVSQLLWAYILCHYALFLSMSDKEDATGLWKGRRLLLRILVITSVILIMLLPIEHVISDELNTMIYLSGLAVYVTYGISLFYIFLASLFNLKFLKIINKSTKLEKAKIVWIYTTFMWGLVLAVLQFFMPELTLVAFIETILVVIMYLFLENPDLKILNEIDNAKMVADKANNAKTNFLSSMSHEIRTPLNAIVGLSEHMKSTPGISDKVRDDIESITAASNNLLEIIGNIIDINKIESDRLEIVLGNYVFIDEVEPLIRVISTRIGDKPIKLNVDIDRNIPFELNGDKFHVKSIINNLLTNAIKYTERGIIDFSVKCEELIPNESCTLVITVKDTGVGIKQENLSKIFTKFERLDFEGSTKVEGSGLGLSIAKKIVDLMNGSITATSEYGKGSTFVARIPQKISKMECELTNTQRIDIESINARIMSDTYAGYKILIVDDNKLNLKVAKKAIEPFNFEIDECINGAEALEKVKANHYDIILMDIMMPIMSGEKAMEELKKIEGFNTPVIAVTADAIAGSKEKYLGEGFTDYIAKPFTKEGIKVKLDSVFRGNANKDEI